MLIPPDAASARPPLSATARRQRPEPLDPDLEARLRRQRAQQYGRAVRESLAAWHQRHTARRAAELAAQREQWAVQRTARLERLAEKQQQLQAAQLQRQRRHEQPLQPGSPHAVSARPEHTSMNAALSTRFASSPLHADSCLGAKLPGPQGESASPQRITAVCSRHQGQKVRPAPPGEPQAAAASRTVNSCSASSAASPADKPAGMAAAPAVAQAPVTASDPAAELLAALLDAEGEGDPFSIINLYVEEQLALQQAAAAAARRRRQPAGNGATARAAIEPPSAACRHAGIATSGSPAQERPGAGQSVGPLQLAQQHLLPQAASTTQPPAAGAAAAAAGRPTSAASDSENVSANVRHRRSSSVLLPQFDAAAVSAELAGDGSFVDLGASGLTLLPQASSATARAATAAPAAAALPAPAAGWLAAGAAAAAPERTQPASPRQERPQPDWQQLLHAPSAAPAELVLPSAAPLLQDSSKHMYVQQWLQWSSADTAPAASSAAYSADPDHEDAAEEGWGEKQVPQCLPSTESRTPQPRLAHPAPQAVERTGQAGWADRSPPAQAVPQEQPQAAAIPVAARPEAGVHGSGPRSASSRSSSVVTSSRRPGAPPPPGSSSMLDGSTSLSGSVDFGQAGPPGWQLPNHAARQETSSAAAATNEAAAPSPPAERSRAQGRAGRSALGSPQAQGPAVSLDGQTLAAVVEEGMEVEEAVGGWQAGPRASAAQELDAAAGAGWEEPASSQATDSHRGSAPAEQASGLAEEEPVSSSRTDSAESQLPAVLSFGQLQAVAGGAMQVPAEADQGKAELAEAAAHGAQVTTGICMPEVALGAPSSQQTSVHAPAACTLELAAAVSAAGAAPPAGMQRQVVQPQEEVVRCGEQGESEAYSSDFDSDVEISYGQQYGASPSGTPRQIAQAAVHAAAAAGGTAASQAPRDEQLGRPSSPGAAAEAAGGMPQQPAPGSPRLSPPGFGGAAQRPCSPLHGRDDPYPGSPPASPGSAWQRQPPNASSRPLSPASQPVSRRTSAEGGNGSSSRPGSPAGAAVLQQECGAAAAAGLASPCPPAAALEPSVAELQQDDTVVVHSQASSADTEGLLQSGSGSPYALLRFGADGAEGAEAGGAEGAGSGETGAQQAGREAASPNDGTAAPLAGAAPDAEVGSPPGTPTLVPPGEDDGSCPGSARVDDSTVVQTVEHVQQYLGEVLQYFWEERAEGFAAGLAPPLDLGGYLAIERRRPACGDPQHIFNKLLFDAANEALLGHYNQALSSYTGRLAPRLALLSRELLERNVVQRVLRWAGLGAPGGSAGSAGGAGAGGFGFGAAGGAVCSGGSGAGGGDDLAAMLAEDALEEERALQQLAAAMQVDLAAAEAAGASRTPSLEAERSEDGSSAVAAAPMADVAAPPRPP